MLSMFKVTLYTFTCLLFAKSVVGELIRRVSTHDCVVFH